MRPEIYFSVDIEADGPIPGPYSMLSLGAAAFRDGNENPIATFTTNLKALPGAGQDPKTMEFWAKHLTAWRAVREDPKDPAEAIPEFVRFVREVTSSDAGAARGGSVRRGGHQPVFVAYPAGFDFTFVYWYLIRFAKTSPFSFSALDMRSFAMPLLKRPYRECTKKNFPQRWFPEAKHTHIALDDAIEQGIMFIRMKQEAEEGAPRKLRVPEGAFRQFHHGKNL